MRRFTARIPDPERWPFWLFVTLCIKVLTLGVLLSTHGPDHNGAGRLGLFWGDTPGYFVPIESLLENGNYTPDLRMPGYGALYLLVRLVSTPPGTYDVIIILQVLLAAWSMYVLSRLTYRLSGSRAVFLITLVTYAVSISVQWYDIMLMTESFVTSALILFLDRYHTWHRARDPKALLIAGCWLTWAIFLKPVLAPVAGIVLLGIWISRSGRTALLRDAFIFLLPLIVIDGAWMVRNWIHHQQLIPLTRTLFVSEDHPDPKLAASRFVLAFGGDIVWWVDPQAELRFFNVGNDQIPGQTNATSIHLPERIMTSAYDLDSLAALSQRILLLKDPSLPAETVERASAEINAELDRYRIAFITEHPIQYHVQSRWLALVRFLKQSGNPIAYRLTFAEMPFPLKVIKLFHIALHWCTILLGVIGAVFWWRGSTVRGFVVVPVLLVPFGLLIFPLVLRFSEHRYFVPFIPFLLIAAVVGLHSRFFKHTSVP